MGLSQQVCHQLAADKRGPGRGKTMTKRELAICCAILERRGLRYCPQPGSRDGQAGVVLWLFTPGGILIELHAGSMWGFRTFLNLIIWGNHRIPRDA